MTAPERRSSSLGNGYGFARFCLVLETCDFYIVACSRLCAMLILALIRIIRFKVDTQSFQKELRISASHCVTGSGSITRIATNNHGSCWVVDIDIDVAALTMVTVCLGRFRIPTGLGF